MARILVVDDDQDILRLAEKILTAANYEVITAIDAVKAMEILHSTHIDALISDGNMPQYSGFDLVQTIKNNKRFEKLAIAMLTGLRERKDIERAIRMGVDDYIVKPIDPMLFLKKVENLFAKKPAEDRPEIHFATTTTLTQASVTFDMEIRSVSEMGLVIVTGHYFPEGSMIDLKVGLFENLKIKAPPCKVFATKSLGDLEYEIRCNFVGASEPFLQKLRAWIYSEMAHKTKSAG